MFFAQTLKKKLYANYGDKLNKIQDCFYPFNASKNNNKALLYDLKSENQSFTHIQLKQMSKNDYLKNFSKQNLEKKWKRKIKVNYKSSLKRFPQKNTNKRILEAKKYIKNFVDKDIFQVKPQEWNNSTKLEDNKFNIKENLKKIKYEINHNIQDIILLDNKIKPSHNDSNFIMHDDINNKWNVCSKLEIQEKNIMDKELYLRSLNTTQKYWLKKNFSLNDNTINKCNKTFMNVNNKKLIDLSCDCKNQLFEEKKNNITPYENYLENQKYLKCSKSYSNIKKTRKKSDLLTYRGDYNYWKDKDLSQKIKLIDNWSEPSIFGELNRTYSPIGLKMEMLKKLMYNKQKIKKEEIRIKNQKKYDSYIKHIKDLENKKRISVLNISKYPMTFKQKSLLENKKESENEELMKNEDNKTFIEACQKVIVDQNNKNKKRIYTSKNIKNYVGKYMYIHPGVYRNFSYIIPKNDFEDDDNETREEEYMAWSCCNNTEKNSRGCEKIFIKTYNQNSGNIL